MFECFISRNVFLWEPVPCIFPFLSKGVLLKQWLCVALGVSWKKGHRPSRGAGWKGFQCDSVSPESPLNLPRLRRQMRPKTLFSSCSLRGIKWPVRTQLATCLPRRESMSGTLPCDAKWGAEWGRALICLFGIDSYNYRVIKAFDREQGRGSGLLTVLCVWVNWSWMDIGGWLSTAYWVARRTPWDLRNNNGRING